MLNTIEDWLLNVFLGKVVARAAVTIAGALAAGPIHSGLATMGILSVNFDQATFTAGTIALAHAGFEWLKAHRLAATATPSVTPPAAKVAWAALIAAGCLMASPAHAWDFSAPKTFTYSDSSAYVKSIRGGSDSQLATGGCFGPMGRLSTNGNWIADVGSVCVYGAAGIQGQGTAVVPAVQILNLWGFRAGIGYDPITSKLANGDSMSQRDRVKLLFGVSVIGAMQTAAPVVNTITAPVVNVLTPSQ